jgi:hypothetical protein
MACWIREHLFWRLAGCFDGVGVGGGFKNWDFRLQATCNRFYLKRYVGDCLQANCLVGASSYNRSRGELLQIYLPSMNVKLI